MKLRKVLGLGYKETLLETKRGDILLKITRHVYGQKSEVKATLSKIKKTGKAKKPFATIPMEDFLDVDKLVIEILKYLLGEIRRPLR